MLGVMNFEMGLYTKRFLTKHLTENHKSIIELNPENKWKRKLPFPLKLKNNDNNNNNVNIVNNNSEEREVYQGRRYHICIGVLILIREQCRKQ